MEIDTLELSVDIFDEPKHTKDKNLDVTQNVTPNQKIMDVKNLIQNRCSKDSSRHVAPILGNSNFSKQALKSTKSLPKYFLEHKSVGGMNANLRNRMNLENSNDSIKSFNNSFESTKFHLITNKNALMSSKGNSLATNGLKKDDDNSSTYVDNQLQNDRNIAKNMRKIQESRRKIIGYNGKIQENSKPNDDECKGSRKKQKILRTETERVLNSNDNGGQSKGKREYISNNENVNYDTERKETKIITTRFLANENLCKLRKGFKTIVKSRTIQKQKNIDNKVSNMAAKILENHNGKYCI